MNTMKMLSIRTLFVFLSFNCFAQIEFEKGYFIDNAGVRKECFIKNEDWKNNPTSIVYKDSQESSPIRLTVQEILEFGIIDEFKFIKATVNIDRSSNIVAALSEKRSFEYNQETLFLKVLVEGKASLYYYEDGNLNRFFYQPDDATIKPLGYKKYVNSNNFVSENNEYKQQLYNELKTKSYETSRIDKIAYDDKDLKAYFITYNEENNEAYISFDKRISKKGAFHFSLVAELYSRSLLFEVPNTSFPDVDFGNNFGFGFGFELEAVFPFNKNKWSIFLEPTYKNYKAETVVSSSGADDNAMVDFNSIEVVTGLRHYFFLDKSSKLFLNGFVVFNLISETEVDLGQNRPNVFVGRNMGVGAGIGYDYSDKFGIELRYENYRDIILDTAGNPSNRSADYQGLSLVLSYHIF